MKDEKTAALRQRPVVDDAMVERAWFAGMREYARLTLSHEDDPDAIDLAAMRAALLAAYPQDNGGK